MAKPESPTKFTKLTAKLRMVPRAVSLRTVPRLVPRLESLPATKKTVGRKLANQRSRPTSWQTRPKERGDDECDFGYNSFNRLWA